MVWSLTTLYQSINIVDNFLQTIFFLQGPHRGSSAFGAGAAAEEAAQGQEAGQGAAGADEAGGGEGGGEEGGGGRGRPPLGTT
jgi:hypothetical protein